jgi:hypothetical protein
MKPLKVYSRDEKPFLMRAHETCEKHFRFRGSVRGRQVALEYEIPLNAAAIPHSSAVHYAPYINTDSAKTR